MTIRRPTRDPTQSRRAFLRGTAGALAVGTTALGGCMSTLPPLGQRVRYGRVDVPPRGDPVYADWLPEPGALVHEGGGPIDPLDAAIFTTPGRLGRETIGADVSLGSSIMRARLDYFGVGFENYDWALGIGPSIVLAGDVPVDEVHETLTGTVYEQVDDVLDFDCYRRRDHDRVVAVSGTHVVYGLGDRATDAVETLVETGRGRRAGAVDVDADAARFVEAVGASPFTWYEPGPLGIDQQGEADPIEAVASAHSFTFDDGAAYFIFESTFEPGNVPTRARVTEALETRSRAVRSGGVDISRTDRLLTVEMRIDETEVDRDAEVLVVPQVTWSETYDAESDTLRVTHRAGDPVDADSLEVRFDDGRADGRLAPTTGTIGPGDSLSVDLAGRETEDVRIFTTSEDRLHQSILYSFEGVGSGAGPDGDGDHGETETVTSTPEDQPDDRT